ncbi:MAG: hypothetical protein MZV64_16895 [Ignavibacteriales bacterium]|nr:hypothetical protein [Ignavibacteriales bacterium]
MKKILVVDDEEAIRLLYKEELTEAGLPSRRGEGRGGGASASSSTLGRIS